MIEINLIPPEYRKKRKRSLLTAGLNIPLEVLIGSIAGLVALLIMIHVSLLLVNIIKLSQRDRLLKKQEEIRPQKEKVEVIMGQLRELQNSFQNVEKITGADKFSWAKKMNILSDSMPRGVWLNRMALDDGVLFIEGSAISKMSKEIINVHSFTSALKDDQEFMDDFVDLELGSILRRRVQKIEVADFLITTRINKE